MALVEVSAVKNSALNLEWICGALTVMVFLALLGTAVAADELQQPSIDALKVTLNSQYVKIEHTIREPPSIRQYPVAPEYKRHLREWQDDLAQAFAAAADTVKQILKLNPPNKDYWQDRLETLELYSQPISSPEERKVFGASEMYQSAGIGDLPEAEYTDEARASKTKGEVRLRLVLAADGTVKNVFPIKSLPHGLAEAAMTAARRIKFEPAIRKGKPASQFLTLVYEFKDGGTGRPYIPKTTF
jgi:TonB family protein